jgi:PRTRC genetic system protein D
LSDTTPASIIPAAAVDVGFYQTKYAYGRARDGSIMTGKFTSDVADPSEVNSDAARRDGYVVKRPEAKYFVGEGSSNHLGASAARGHRPGYALENSYKALYTGALAYSARHCCPEATTVKIEQMVVALPYADYFEYRNKLQESCGGVHRVQRALGDDLVITVQNVRVVPQPMGALFNAIAGKFPKAADKITLISDMGGGTHDYYVTKALVPQTGRCGSTGIGTLAIARHVCELIKKGAGDKPASLAKIDEALRNPSTEPVMLAGHPHDLSKFAGEIERQVDKSLKEMIKKVKDFTDLDLIIFTGGGANYMRKAAERDPTLADYAGICHVDEDSVFSNVKGFFIRAEQLASAKA